jgi:hypothetical protein
MQAMKHKKNRHSKPESATVVGSGSGHLPEVINFNYEGNEVGFTVDGKVMVNATEMAKPFGTSKGPKHWLTNQSTKEFLNELGKVRILTLPDLVKINYGGNNPGTWMHEDVAIEFARWLSPKFAIWCNDRIKELVANRMQAPMPFNPEALNQSMQKLAELTTQNFTAVRNEIAGIDERLRVLEQRKRSEAIPSGENKSCDRYDHMNLVLVNFQQPAYLNRKMKQYCVMKQLSIRTFLNELITSEIIKEIKI